MKVTKYKKAEKEGYLIASFSVAYDVPKYGVMFCNDIQLFQKDGRRWIAFPQRKYEKDGEVQFFAYTGCCDRAGAEAFRSDAINAIELFCIEAQIPFKENEIKQPNAYKDEQPIEELVSKVHKDFGVIPTNAQKCSLKNDLSPRSVNPQLSDSAHPGTNCFQVDLPF